MASEKNGSVSITAYTHLHASSAFRYKLFKLEILKENYTFKWHLEFADKS